MNNKLKEKYGVIGDPISHSRSPEIHRLFAQQFDEKIDYSKYHIKADNLNSLLSIFIQVVAEVSILPCLIKCRQ